MVVSGIQGVKRVDDGEVERESEGDGLEMYIYSVLFRLCRWEEIWKRKNIQACQHRHVVLSRLCRRASPSSLLPPSSSLVSWLSSATSCSRSSARRTGWASRTG